MIGSEYACMFAALGTRVHLIDGRDTLLPFLDPDLSKALAAAMERRASCSTGRRSVEKCVAPRRRRDRTDAELRARTRRSITCWCARGGRARPTELDPDAAGFGLTTRGLIPVDEHFRTTVPHIYAVGDVIGFPALASTSSEQGRVAACHAFGSDVKKALAQFLPAGIYTIPELSTVGLTEPQAKEKGIDYVVGRADYAHNPRGQIIGDKSGFLKLVFARDDMKLLGVHVIGEQATEVVHIGLMALMTGGGADLFLDTCFNYPTLGDLYKLATHDALLKRHAFPRKPAEGGGW